MQLLDLTLATPAENLALDEALLEWAEARGADAELLRLWEPQAPFVVVGRSSQVAVEVDLEACAAAGVPVLRRTSGGAAIVAGPGCLMYAVVLSIARRRALESLAAAHATVLDTMAAGLGALVPGVRRAGTSDLALEHRKFSGNSLRVKRTHLLYHGTLLYDFPLDLVGRSLRMPPRQPEYRASRSHGEFIANLPVDAAALRQAIATAWGARGPLAAWPRDRVAELVAEKYSRAAWTHQR